ncbi:unnamed protein product [Adineta steineri]|uniref:G-protein coupled receptors family 1 profile domain-containing protein n=1 Tax=Adineta steineri TaxID=433720 RepID=A0A815J536_9BILA|nr:unnamed protein product [Adineta steineri]
MFSSSSIIASLTISYEQIFIYFGIPILIFGLIGNTLNIIVLMSLETFRQNSCAFYLTIMSIVNIAQLITGLLTRIMSGGYSIDWTQISLFYCKFRIYIFQLTSFISFSCISLATIDQYFATCTRERWQQWCHIKIAYRLLILISFILIIEQLPGLIFFDQKKIVSAVGNTTICTVTDTYFIQFNNYFNYLILGNLLPFILTFFFGLMAYHNVQQLAYRTIPLVRRELDKQLTVMVLTQVVYNFITLLPNLILYLIVSYGNIQDLIIKAQLNVVNAITICLYYAYFAGPFYIYTCVSKRFRRQLFYVLFKMYKNIYREQRVGPDQTIS